GGRRRHAHRLAGQTSLAEEVAGPEQGDDGLLALSREHRQLDLPVVDEEDRIRAVALREDRLALLVVAGRPSLTDRHQQRLGVDRRFALDPHAGQRLTQAVGAYASSSPARRRGRPSTPGPRRTDGRRAAVTAA